MSDATDIDIFHVGGGGEIGPLTRVLFQYPKQTRLVLFEARREEAAAPMAESVQRLGVRAISVNACLAGESGRALFYVNRHLESSSLLPMDPTAKDEHVEAYLNDDGVRTWEQEAENDHVLEMECVTLEQVARGLGIAPDVLSVDAQGMDLAIVKGLGPLLNGVNVVMMESAFKPIYQGQSLFSHEMDYMLPHGFRLAGLLNSQYWHPGPSVGTGLLTVAESLWVRDPRSFFDPTREENEARLLEQGVKLAAVALAMERDSYVAVIVRGLLERYGEPRVRKLFQESGYGLVLDLIDLMATHRRDYERDGKWYLHHLKWERVGLEALLQREETRSDLHE